VAQRPAQAPPPEAGSGLVMVAFISLAKLKVEARDGGCLTRLVRHFVWLQTDQPSNECTESENGKSDNGEE
jgi:hypothetical protein